MLLCAYLTGNNLTVYSATNSSAIHSVELRELEDQ